MPMFRVVNGSHSNGERDPATGKLITYKKGEVFESKHDLVKTHNSNVSVKFERMPEGALPSRSPVAQAAIAGASQALTPPGKSAFGSAELEVLTIEELKKLAEQEEIDLGKLTSKKDIIARIQSAVPA